MRFASTIALLALSSLLICVRPTNDVEAGTAIKLDIAGLVREADLVLEGRVIATHVQRDDRGRIETEYTLTIVRTFLGEPLTTRIFRLPGGVLPDGSGLILPGMPTLELGEDALVFLSQPGSTGLRMPVGLAQGKFKIVRDAHGLANLVRTQTDLTLVDPTTGSVQPSSGWTALDYQATAKSIETAVALKLARK
jgi:hypothetical protein